MRALSRLPALHSIAVTVGIALLAQGAFAADLPLGGCDFDGDGVADRAYLSRGRSVLLESGEKARLSGRYSEATCADLDGDGRDEVVVTKGARRAAYQVGRARPAGLRGVCKSVRSLLQGEIYKSKASNHITDQRRLSTSFITLARTRPPKNNCLYGFARNGTLIHKLGRYFPSGALYSSRYYGGSGCGDLKSAALVASMARRAGGSPSIYLTSGTGVCAYVPDASRCYHSSGC